MNLSRLVTRIKINLGIYATVAPFENVEETIKEIIQTITIPTFSLYCPYYQTYRFDLHNLEQLEKDNSREVYLLPDIFSERKLLFIKDVRYDESTISGIGYWGGGIPLLQGNMLNQILLSNAGMSLTNKAVPKMTFRFEPPRTVTLWNVFSSNHVVFELAFEHEQNLGSISPTTEESFYNLAILDVKDAFYQTMKHYNEIQVANGSVNMRLDEWSNAAEQRKALLDDWDNIYHIDVLPFTYA